MYIYKITNLINNKVYIGQTINKDPYRRINRHFTNSKHKSKSLIWDAIQKYGKESFKINIILKCNDIRELNQKEKEFIIKYKCLSPNGYNLKAGGDQGGALSDELKAQIGKKVKEWYKNNNHPFKGKCFSEDHVKKMSEVRKGFTSKNRKSARLKNAEKSKIPIIAINLKTKEEFLFSSIKDCANVLKLQASNISRVLNNKQNRKQHKGYSFKKKCKKT